MAEKRVCCTAAGYQRPIRVRRLTATSMKPSRPSASRARSSPIAGGTRSSCGCKASSSRLAPNWLRTRRSTTPCGSTSRSSPPISPAAAKRRSPTSSSGSPYRTRSLFRGAPILRPRSTSPAPSCGAPSVASSACSSPGA